MKHLLSLGILLLASSTQAALIPTFEFFGNAADVGGGVYDADTGASSASDADIESFLGLTSGSLDALSPSGNNAREGSAIKVTVDVQGGDEVSFDWAFSTDEDPNDQFCPASQCRDFAFYSAELTTADGLFLLADALDDNSGALGSASLVASGAGTLQIGIGVMDVNDTLISSFLTTRNFVFTDNNTGPPGAMPAPMTLALFGLGLLSVGASRRRKAD